VLNKHRAFLFANCFHNPTYQIRVQAFSLVEDRGDEVAQATTKSQTDADLRALGFDCHMTALRAFAKQ
jgi:hypothetical protein